MKDPREITEVSIARLHYEISNIGDHDRVLNMLKSECHCIILSRGEMERYYLSRFLSSGHFCLSTILPSDCFCVPSIFIFRPFCPPLSFLGPLIHKMSNQAFHPQLFGACIDIVVL